MRIYIESKYNFRGTSVINVDKTFITENLTRHRYVLLKRLNTLRVGRKIHSRLAKETERSRPLVVKSRQDIYRLGGENLNGDEEDLRQPVHYTFYIFCHLL